MVVTVLKNNEAILTGHKAMVCEAIEKMIEARLGFAPFLQESINDGVYQACLHKDSYEDLEDSELEQLKLLRITEDPVLATEAIKRFLNVDFKLVA